MRKGEKKECEQEREREREGEGEGEVEGDKRRVLANLFIKTRTQIVKSFLLSFSLHFLQKKYIFAFPGKEKVKSLSTVKELCKKYL